MKDSKKVIVTGGMGYIGSHTVVELLQNGFEPWILDDLSNSNINVLDGIESISGVRPHFIEMDVCDKEALRSFLKENSGFSSVIHFAAFKAVGESVAEPLKYYRNNLLGVVNVLEEMLHFDIPNFVFSSSATVYGQPDVLPATEESPIQAANSPYGNTKQINEEIIRDTVFANDQLNAIALRYFNPIGAHDSALIGELPLGKPNNLMPFITQTAAGIYGELKVFGGDYNTPDGTAVRDYIHVVDLAKAHVVALGRMIKNKNKEKYEYFNLGTGHGFSVLEVIQSFERSTGEKLNYKIVDRRAGDVEQIYASTKLANEELGWKAELSIDEMTASSWAWEKKLRGIK